MTYRNCHLIHRLAAASRRAVLCLSALGAIYATGCDGGNRDTPAAPEASAVQATAPGPTIRFLNYAEGYAESLESSRPMLVLFTSAKCRYCQQMLEGTLANRDVVALSAEFVCVRVEVESTPELCRRFGVQAFPTVQFMTARGVSLNRVTGTTSPTDFVLHMRAALQAVARRLRHAPVSVLR